MSKYVNWGCGIYAPVEWENYDNSWNLNKLPKNVKYGNFITGYPVKTNSCDGVFASHVIEHLAFYDALKAIKNVKRVLKPGGIFRVITPKYIHVEEWGEWEHNLIQVIKDYFRTSKHRWWYEDYRSLRWLLGSGGFNNIRICKFGDSKDRMFSLVEQEDKFENAFAMEAIA